MVYTVHWPSHRMPWLMKQELRRAQGRSAWLQQEVALPGLTKRWTYGAAAGAAVAGVGQFDGQMLSLSPLRRALSDRDGRMQEVQYTFAVEDEGDAIAALDPRQIKGSAATLRLVSAGAPWAKAFVAFSGVVDRYSLVGDHRWEFTIAANDAALRLPSFPRARIDAADFFGLPAASAAQDGPLIYGKHSSQGNTAKGAVPLVALDAEGLKYLVAWGRMKAVDPVYSDGVLKTLGADYSLSFPVSNSGRTYTRVTFVAAQGTKAITADMEGYESVGDGSGALVENPVEEFKHLLVNWIFNDYKSGTWFADSTAPVDVPMFRTLAAQFAGARGARRIFGQKIQPFTVIDEIAKSWGLLLCWTNAGLLGATVDVAATRDIYLTDRWCRHDSCHQPQSATATPDWDSIISSVTISHFYAEAAGKYLGSLEIEDPRAPQRLPDALELPWSAAHDF